MIYITQLIFVKEGKEMVFQEFENFAIPLKEKYNSKLLYRLRPDDSVYVSADSEKPYEIHIVSFDSEMDLQQFMKDDTRLKFIHLKNESVKTMLLIKGEKM